MATRMIGIVALCVLTLLPRTPLYGQAPPLPTDVPVLLVGHAAIDGTRLQPFDDARLSIGPIGKDGPLALGQRIEEAAFQLMSLRAERLDGRDVWVRSIRTYRAGGSEPLAEAEIVMDRRSLAPILATVSRGGTQSVSEYDWGAHVVHTGETETSFDLRALEAGAHETWMSAIDWREGLRVMVPTVLGGRSKWWAVPRVVGTEEVDLGDGEPRTAWVVELDWWGMGRDHETFTPGGGVNGTAGTGGKYWVLRNPVAGLPRVIRVRTEVDASTDNVVQIQGGGG